jgi:hypothetical protein
MGLQYQGAVQCDFGGLNTTGASVAVTGSNDGGVYGIAKGTLVPTAATSAAVLELDHLDDQLYQAVYSPGTATGGSVSCWFLGK